jgi:hypothetical protein
MSSYIKHPRAIGKSKFFDDLGNDVTAWVESLMSEQGLKSDPPVGKKKVTNVYVEIVEGEPKLRVEYEE